MKASGCSFTVLIVWTRVEASKKAALQEGYESLKQSSIFMSSINIIQLSCVETVSDMFQ